ncbi:MAG TPA: D-glycero-beta-D-manno-heptose 1,7-bisphosphate 7-phosphatase [Chthonomonadaceae bacterium]|nr:D-glycero-beta-D-manno-heptose 1,7-bisphosphate 7-phosphatase [Chthonomonadaceae bacterium]
MREAGSERRAVFLDRDGVLTVEGGAYVTRPDALHLLPGAAEAVARLTAAGWPVIVITNQAGVGRGYLSLEELEAVHARLRAEIETAGGRLTAIYACPHCPEEGCDCRKPRPGLLRQAAADLGLDLCASYMVGDSPRDIAAGHAVGCRTILVLTGHTRQYDPATFPPPHPDFVFADLAAAADWLCRQSQE